MISDEKRLIVDEINRLMRERPKDWDHARRKLLTKLAKLEDPYGAHAMHGSERAGRREHRSDCPEFDRMDGDARP